MYSLYIKPKKHQFLNHLGENVGENGVSRNGHLRSIHDWNYKLRRQPSILWERRKHASFMVSTVLCTVLKSTGTAQWETISMSLACGDPLDKHSFADMKLGDMAPSINQAEWQLKWAYFKLCWRDRHNDLFHVLGALSRGSWRLLYQAIAIYLLQKFFATRSYKFTWSSQVLPSQVLAAIGCWL